MIAIRRRPVRDDARGFVPVEHATWSLTRSGQWLGFLTLVFWAAGFAGDRNAFLVAAAVMAPLLILSVPLSRAALRGLLLRPGLPRRAVASRPFRMTVDVMKPCGLLGTHGLRLSPAFLRGRPLMVVHAKPGQRARAAGTFLIPRRGVYVVEWIRVTTLFPFGLVRRTAVAPVTREIVVHPDPGRLDARFLRPDLARVRGDGFEVPRAGEDEFYGLRDHRPGDRLRNISWRVTARLGRLVVRELRARAEGELDVILHGRARPSRELAVRVERAVDFTAALVDRARRDGARLRLEVRGTRPGVVQVDAHPFTYVRAMDLLAGFGPGLDVRPRPSGRGRRRHATRRIHVMVEGGAPEGAAADEIVVRADDPGTGRLVHRPPRRVRR